MQRFPFILIILLLTVMGIGQAQQFTGLYLYQNQVSRVFAVTQGDLDNDSLPDIVFSEPDQPLFHWMKNGDNGQFILHQVSDFPAIGMQVADLDADGMQDILACSYDLNLVVWFRNLGDESFAMDTLSAWVQHPLVVSAGDADGDGDPDVAVATQDAGTGVVLLVNDGTLHFTPMQLDTQSYSSTWTRITDLDMDGNQDILGVWFNDAGGLMWYRQTAPLVFEKHFIPCPAVHGAAVGDIDGDGDLDIAAATCGYELAWLENGGNGNFFLHYLFNSYNCAVSVGIADIDKDSDNDIAVTVYGSKRIEWWRNEGSNTFTRNLICDTLSNPSDLCIADLTGDGFPEVLTGSYKKKLAFFENTAAGVGMTGTVSRGPCFVSTDRENRMIRLRLQPTVKGPLSVVLIDVGGRVVYEQNRVVPATGLNIRVDTAGLYILVIAEATETWEMKIVMP